MILTLLGSPLDPFDSQAQVSALDNNFDRHAVPLDVVWLDIEHTVGKRYLTWDSLHMHYVSSLTDTLFVQAGKRHFTWDRSLFPDPPLVT